MTDEHDDERFMVVRAIHLQSWSERLDSVPFGFVEEWTKFGRITVERIVQGLVDSKHVTIVVDKEDEEVRTLQLTKTGRDWPTRQ